MRKMTVCICENCKKEFEKADSEIKRNLKRGRLNFCSISCAIQYRNSTNPSQAQLDAREKFSKNFAGLSGEANFNKKDTYSKFKETLRRAKMHTKQSKKLLECTITLEDLKN